MYRGDYSIKKQKSNTKLYCLLFINRNLPQPPEDDKIKKIGSGLDDLLHNMDSFEVSGYFKILNEYYYINLDKP